MRNSHVRAHRQPRPRPLWARPLECDSGSGKRGLRPALQPKPRPTATIYFLFCFALLIYSILLVFYCDLVYLGSDQKELVRDAFHVAGHTSQADGRENVAVVALARVESLAFVLDRLEGWTAGEHDFALWMRRNDLTDYIVVFKTKMLFFNTFE